MTAAAARSSRPRDSLTQIALQRGTRCSAGRDVFFILAGAQLPCSIQGTASNVACGYFTLSRSGVKGKAPDLPGIVNASSSQGMDLAPTPWLYLDAYASQRLRAAGEDIAVLDILICDAAIVHHTH